MFQPKLRASGDQAEKVKEGCFSSVGSSLASDANGGGGKTRTQPLKFTHLFRQDGAEISMALWKHLSADAGWCCAERSAARYDPRPRDVSRRHVVLQEKAF